MKQQINKKNKKSNQPVNFDIEQLEKELIKKPIVYKDSKSDKRKRK